MRTLAGEHRAVVDAFTQLIADVTDAPDDGQALRLRELTASALKARLRDDPSLEAIAQPLTRLHQVVPDEVRSDLVERLETPADPEASIQEALLVTRQDQRETLLSGSLINSLSGLMPGERLGPFETQGGIPIWFDFYFPARRMEVRETGVTAPAIVFTKARLPIIRRGNTTIDIEPGTVWIRGNLILGSLPADTFVGVKVTGGTLRLNRQATITGDIVEIPAPIKGTLRLDLAADEVTPAEGACTASGAAVTLPDSLTLTLDAGSSTATGGNGTATLWGQEFSFGPSTGNWTFIERLWTVVLSYTVSPMQFDAAPISDDLVQFQGTGDVSNAGLGLPVVVATNPAILGETATAAGWFLQVQGLTARWYDPDPRFHTLDSAWIGISPSGVLLTAEDVAPLVPAVTHSYALWIIGGGSTKRLPWKQSYKEKFTLFYRCHVVTGEDFLVTGQADVALDRPVTTDGIPISTPTTTGALLLHQFNGVITAMLGATIEEDTVVHQFALRNALVWTSTPALIIVRGTLTLPQAIDSGDAQLLFGVFEWVPTLPDPYVSNAFINRPRRVRGAAQSLLLGHIAWTTPETVTVSFVGQLGPNLSLGGREVSPDQPQPADKGNSGFDIGPTQVEQDQRTFDRKGLAEWLAAQAQAEENRGQRLEVANQENKRSIAAIEGFMTEAAGPASNILLLDVSTNQDLLGVAVGGPLGRESSMGVTVTTSAFPVSELAVHSQVGGMRVVTLPQVQWEPVRTLDADQNIMTMGWFPTPLASSNDGGSTQIGARSQKLKPIIPEDALQGTMEAYKEGTPVGVRTTFPFGLISAIRLQPQDTAQRKADLYDLTRPKFTDEQATGGIQITAKAEGGRPDDGGISPTFQGWTRQLLNGVDLLTGTPLGISVLGETLQPAGSVETVFNNDMAARPRVPVTRIDLSGYGGSNFSDWNNPFAAFAEAAKVQFRVMIGRTSLEVIKVNSVLHPWGVRVTRSITIERRPGGGVIRRDSGWQAFTPGIFDYRYFDTVTNSIVVAPYVFDAGVFRGLFHVRNIRPAPGTVFTHGTAELVPYYFDADVALENVPGRTGSTGILGYLQVAPNGIPAGVDAIQALIDAQGPIGGPVEAWMDFGGSGLPFRTQRVEVGTAMNSGNPVFVATVRGVPTLPKTGSWSVVTRPVASVPPNGGEASPVAENRGVPIIRRYPVRYLPGDDTPYIAPRLDGIPGDYRFADATDLFTPAAPANDYALLQSTPTHAFLFPRPYVPAASPPEIQSGHKAALADVFARSTSKGSFPPPGNTIELAAGSLHFDVGATGKLALSAPVSIVGYPTPLRVAGTTGHGTSLLYDQATLQLELEEDRWGAEFTGLRFWSDISGMERLTGSEMRVVGSTEQRPQIAEIKSLLLQEVEEILQYIPIFGNRGTQGPIDLGASNAKHELKVEVTLKYSVPPPAVVATFPAGTGVVLTLSVKQSTGIDIKTGGPKASAIFGAELEGKIPVLSVGVATVFIIITGQITFSLTSVSGSVTAEKLELMAFVGVGVEGKIGPFKAYAFLGIGFVLEYDAITSITKYGGLVALEAGVDLTIVKVKIRAELKGLVYKDAGATKCDYTGSVKIQVDIFLIFSISASYQISDTTTL